MKAREKRKDKHRDLLRGVCLAIAFSFVFLYACSAEETAVFSPAAVPSVTETRAASPETSVTNEPAPTAIQPSAPAEETASEDGWAEILVNPSHTLPGDFSVTLADFEGGQVDARILDICEAMFADAKADGVELMLVDAYRSRELQSELFSEKVESYIGKGYGREEAEAAAAAITARPDTSEHQTGLALDIVTPSHTSRNSAFEETEAFAWLDDNAQDCGFILRYPRDKTETTGVIYEPWHWRYVGKAAAAEMKESGQCLEEYLAG